MAFKLDQVKALVRDGRFFSAGFIKRTDGSLRRMLCRTGVKVTHPSLEPRQWTPEEKNLIQVWDVHKRAYRLIPVENILWLQVQGQVHTAPTS